MNKTLPTLLIAATAAVVAVISPLPSYADAKDEPLALEQGATPAITPQARYRSQLDVAEETLRKNLAFCETMASGDRAECVREAQERHDGDVAKASDVLHRPR